jgi:hypothetical protein
MLAWKRILWLRERIREQKKWIDRCGGTLTGYIENYGDPGVTPLKDGKPHIIVVPPEKQHFLENSHKRVPGTTDQFYANHYGDGGTAIYKADYDRLVIWQNELTDLEEKCHAAKVKADEMTGKVKIK